MPNRILKDKVRHVQKVSARCAMPTGMAKKTKCKCRKLNLERAGKVVIRCEKHLGKPSSKRLVCYLDADGILRRA